MQDERGSLTGPTSQSSSNLATHKGKSWVYGIVLALWYAVVLRLRTYVGFRIESWASKKYRGHRVFPESLLHDLAKAKVD